MTPSVLYISYDGMLEPLGQSQILAYHKRLAADRPIYLISFEKADDWANVAESLVSTHDTAVLKTRVQDFSIDNAADRYLELLFPRQQEKNDQEKRSKL